MQKRATIKLKRNVIAEGSNIIAEGSNIIAEGSCNKPKTKIKLKIKDSIIIPPKIQLHIKEQSNVSLEKQCVLSIDVAIKHLSFCVLYKKKIIDWQLIDLLDGQQDISQICIGIKKDGNVCTNKAKWTDAGLSTTPSKMPLSYCDIHVPAIITNNLTSITKKLLCHCGAMAKYNEGQIGYCAKHKGINAKRWYTVDNINDLELRILLFEKLNSYDFSNIKTVLIERQPKLATEKMRSLAYAIFDYFIIRLYCTEKNCINIEWIDPKNKLYVYSGPIIECPIKNQYDRNKWFACKYCLWNLGINNETYYTHFFNDNKKQDDLADCYLQGLYYQQKDGANKTISAQQRSVFTAQNLAKYKKTKARKPKGNNSRIVLAGIKYMIKKRDITQAVRDSIAFYFGDIAIENLY